MEVYVANQTGTECFLRVYERLPVSEIGQVEVDVLEKECSGGMQKEEEEQQGLVYWDVKLPEGAETTLRLVFRVSMPQKVVWDAAPHEPA